VQSSGSQRPAAHLLTVMAAPEAVLQTSSTSLSLKASAFSIASLMSDQQHHHHHHRHQQQQQQQHRRGHHRCRRHCNRPQNSDYDVNADVTVSPGVTSQLSHDAGNPINWFNSIYRSPKWRQTAQTVSAYRLSCNSQSDCVCNVIYVKLCVVQNSW